MQINQVSPEIMKIQTERRTNEIINLATDDHIERTPLVPALSTSSDNERDQFTAVTRKKIAK